MQTLTVAMVQCPLVWENPYANIAAMDRRLSTLQDTVDIIVLPEMFATGFTMNGAPLAEDMGGRRQGGWNVPPLRQTAPVPHGGGAPGLHRKRGASDRRSERVADSSVYLLRPSVSGMVSQLGERL
jgi:hypothetical protein